MSSHEVDRFDTPWRRMAAALFAAPQDSKVFGSLELDVTESLRFVEAKRADGVPMTMTHIVVSALGRALSTHAPELNCYVQWGRVHPREDVVVATAVSLEGKAVSFVKARRAHQRTVTEIAVELHDAVKRTRRGEEEDGAQRRTMLAEVPWPFRRWLFKVVRFLVFDLGWKLPLKGLSKDMFGSVMLTNVGSLGLSYAFTALLPASNLPFVVSMGQVERKPLVDQHDRIVIRSVMPFGAVFDHRVCDGAMIGRVGAAMRRYLLHPEELDMPLELLHQRLAAERAETLP